jgi:superfamily II DNA or RNA helicase
MGAVQVVARQDLWGTSTLKVWAPLADRILHLALGAVAPISSVPPTLSSVIHRAAAARIQEALASELLVAPVRSTVTPLPHQLFALEKAVASPRVRHLFADEVGLGKTIEAGLVLRELKLRGIAKRILIVAPKGLTSQWQAEMQLHFGEAFRIADPSDFGAIARWSDEENIWRGFDQVICSIDGVKPIARRRGWSIERIVSYNQRRFEDLVTADWDLVIIDEAHRLGGSTDQVARYKLGAALADASPNLLLLSATPHSGKTDQFLRLMQLLDRDAFPNEASIERERVAQYVVRTEKRSAIDNEGKPLFRPRQTRLEPVRWEARHEAQRALYNAVTEYVRDGYNQALKSKQRHIGFLMVLMQRLVTSSTAAITSTLRKRLAALEHPPSQLSFDDLDPDELMEMDVQSQLDELVDWPGWRSEKAEVEALLALAEHAMTSPDAKVEALLEHVYRMQREEDDPELKVLIFTEFIPTQALLAEHLRDRGFAVATLNGQMTAAERLEAQDAFAKQARVLISTDAGGEGLNLQFAHVIFNYDMPWNPMKIEQRIGRVDRIGQLHIVRATNFLLEDTVEYRVREVLEEKLLAIAAEFGVDKAADVMDSLEAEAMFDSIYLEGIVDPDGISTKADATLQALRAKIAADIDQRSIMPTGGPLDPGAAQKWRKHPIHYWVEKAVVHGLPELGGSADKVDGGWRIAWPDGRVSENAAFDLEGIEGRPAAVLLTLDDDGVRAVVDHLPIEARGRPVPRIVLSSLPKGVVGSWSLWRVRIEAPSETILRYLPLFVQNGRAFAPTARRIWDLLISATDVPVDDYASFTVDSIQDLAELQGEAIFLEGREKLQRDVAARRTRTDTTFTARRRAIGRIGLENVRRSRTHQLEQELSDRVRELDQSAQVVAGLELVTIAEVAAA